MAEFEIQPLTSTAESPPVSPRARGQKAERPKSDEKQVAEQNRTPEKDSTKDVDKLVENRRKSVVAEELMRHVSFSVNQETGQVTVEVIDDGTEEVIREISVKGDPAKAIDKLADDIRKRSEDVSEKIAAYAEGFKRHVSFSVSKDAGQVVIQVISDETEEVIRQIPMHEAINFKNKIEELLGTFVDREA